MSWLLPELPVAKKTLHRKEERKVYIQQWESDNRAKRNRYWREHYKANKATRREYLNRKQREYRAAAKAAA